jgi:hypothetical protein
MHAARGIRVISLGRRICWRQNKIDLKKISKNIQNIVNFFSLLLLTGNMCFYRFEVFRTTFDFVFEQQTKQEYNFG